MSVGAFSALPDPAQAASVDDLVERLRLLKVWAGAPSYETIKDRVNTAWIAAGRPAGELASRSAVVNCFMPSRRRLSIDLVLAIVAALHPEAGYVARWRQALRVVGGQTEAMAQVRVQDSLPRDLPEFTGRAGELGALRLAARDGGAMVISAIQGMAGVGKTQLAVHAGHLLHREEPFERVLFVNLRGFHPDPQQPPADPVAVLDGFLRLLGVSGHQIPHGLDARAAAYRSRLAGIRSLVVLDNAATAEQVRPLLPGVPGCLVLVTSRRSLAGALGAAELPVDGFTPGEAATFLTGAVADVPAGPDPGAIARICRRCGHLPLALSLIAGHIRGVPGWTLTDHADRLDERHDARHLDTGVELALGLSYQDLPADRQRLLRLTALHPGQDFDVHAAAALTGTGPADARVVLEHLRRDHLLQPAGPGRYAFHDLVRTYAAGRAHDQDRPPERRDAMTRLFDHYLATAAAAMNTLHPTEAHLRPAVPPAGTPGPDLTDSGAAAAWLDAERHTLIAVAGHAATRGWPAHCVHLAQTLARYLRNGYYSDAEVVHGHAIQAARDAGDLAAQAHLLIDLGHARLMLGRDEPTAQHFRRALDLFRKTGDPAGQARALFNLGGAEQRSGNLPAAIDLDRQAVVLYRLAGDRIGEARALGNISVFLKDSGRLAEAVEAGEQALTIARQVGHPYGEAVALHGLGEVEVLLGRYEAAGEHLRRALALYRELGDLDGEAGLLDGLGMLHTRTGRFAEAIDCHQRAAARFHELGTRHGEAWALNGLGEAFLAAGRAADALGRHTAAHAAASEIGDLDQQARAHTGLGDVHDALADHARAREHYEKALVLYARLGAPEAGKLRARLGKTA